MTFVRKPSPIDSRKKTRGLYLIAALALAISISALIEGPVQARWKSEYADAPYSEWFAQQYDSDGRSCCDHSDAHAVYDAYIKYRKWYVPIDGIHHEIQQHQLLDGPNPTGHAIVWYNGVGDHVTIYCFAPGPMY
jgi:hypothetical protein